MRDSRRRVRREIARALRSPVSDRPTIDAALQALNRNRLIEARILARFALFTPARRSGDL